MLHARAVAIVVPTIIQCHSADLAQKGLQRLPDRLRLITCLLIFDPPQTSRPLVGDFIALLKSATLAGAVGRGYPLLWLSCPRIG